MGSSFDAHKENTADEKNVALNSPKEDIVSLRVLTPNPEVSMKSTVRKNSPQRPISYRVDAMVVMPVTDVLMSTNGTPPTAVRN